MKQDVTAGRKLTPVYRMLVLPWLAWLTFLVWQIVLMTGIPAIMQPLVAQFREDTRLVDCIQDFNAAAAGPFWAIVLLAAGAALVFPRAVQHRHIRRARLRTTPSRSSTGWTYREAGAEVELADAASLKRIRDAYYARLAAVILLLGPIVTSSTWYAITVTASFGLGYSARSFAHPGEYLPISMLIAVATLFHAPTVSLVFGRLATPLRSGRLRIHRDANVAAIDWDRGSAGDGRSAARGTQGS